MLDYTCNNVCLTSIYIQYCTFVCSFRQWEWTKKSQRETQSRQTFKFLLTCAKSQKELFKSDWMGEEKKEKKEEKKTETKGKGREKESVIASDELFTKSAPIPLSHLP